MINKQFNIYTYNSLLNVIPLSPEWNNIETDISVYDLTGRKIISHSKQIWVEGETKQINFSEPKGIYIVEIKQGQARTTKKLVIN